MYLTDLKFPFFKSVLNIKYYFCLIYVLMVIRLLNAIIARGKVHKYIFSKTVGVMAKSAVTERRSAPLASSYRTLTPTNTFVAASNNTSR